MEYIDKKPVRGLPDVQQINYGKMDAATRE